MVEVRDGVVYTQDPAEKEKDPEARAFDEFMRGLVIGGAFGFIVALLLVFVISITLG